MDMEHYLRNEILLSLRKMLTRRGMNSEEVDRKCDEFFYDLENNKITSSYFGVAVLYDMI